MAGANRVCSLWGSARMMMALLVLSFIVVYFYSFQVVQPAIVAPKVIETVPVAISTKNFCGTVCVKNQKGSIMAVNDLALPFSLPLPQCSLAQPNVDQHAYEEWQARGYCSTMCAKDENGKISEINGTTSPFPLCRNVVQPNLDFNVDTNRVTYDVNDQFWPRTENLVGGCNNMHGLDRKMYRTLDDVSVHIVYFAWLPSNRMARKVVPEQLYDVERSGLFARPNTFLHIVASTDIDAEYEWLQSLAVVKNNMASIRRVRKNRYEYPGFRMLWELGCKAQSEGRTRDLFVYFHNKGTSYGIGRAGVELALTNEMISNWKLVMNLIATNPSSLTFGLGGLGFHWLTFFWARADIFLTAPMPVMTKSRYWYEHYVGFNLQKEFPDRSNHSQCHLAQGFDSVVEISESSYRPKDVEQLPNDKTTRTFDNFIPEHLNRSGRLPQYSILRCGMMEVLSPAVQKWFRPVMVRFDTYLRAFEKWGREDPPK